MYTPSVIRRSLRYAEELTDAVKQQLALAYSAKDLIGYGLRQKLRELNLRDGKPWLDDSRISTAIGALTRIGAMMLMEANQVATDVLLKGETVDGLPDWNAGRGQTIQYIDWQHPERNQFTVVSQFASTARRATTVARGSSFRISCCS